MHKDTQNAIISYLGHQQSYFNEIIPDLRKYNFLYFTFIQY